MYLICFLPAAASPGSHEIARSESQGVVLGSWLGREQAKSSVALASERRMPGRVGSDQPLGQSFGMRGLQNSKKQGKI